MNMSEVQKQLLDILTYYNHGELGTRTHTVIELIKSDVKRLIDCPEEVDLSDEALLEYASKQYDVDMELKRQENEAMMELWKKKVESREVDCDE